MTVSQGQAQTSPFPAPAAAVRLEPGLRPRLDLWLRLARDRTRLSTLGLVASLVLHITLTSVAMLAGFGLVGGGGGGGGNAEPLPEIDYALGETGGLTIITADLGSNATLSNIGAGDVVDDGVAGPLEGVDGVDEPATGPGLGQLADGLGGAGGGDIGDGMGLGGGGSGGGARFFGVEAAGGRFLYICDVSGSMATAVGAGEDVSGDTRLAALKHELSRSIRALQEHMNFSVVLFSSESRLLIADRKWVLANDGGKRIAGERLTDIVGFGGTEPWPAFEIAFAMRPPPDAIYFLTDGEFDPTVADRIKQRNTGSRRIPIHCITLIERSGEEVMRTIAEGSGGTYRHVGNQRAGSGAGGSGGRP